MSKSKTERDNSTAIEILEKQNEKLRNELKDLENALYSIINRPAASKTTEIPEDSEEKDLRLKLNQFKSEISKMQKELEGNPNIPKITDLENESKFLSKKIAELETEKSNLLKYEKTHKSALDTVKSANTYPEKIQNLRVELRNNKEKLKELTQILTKEEKKLKSYHENCVSLEDKSRKLYDLIKLKKKEPGSGPEKNSEVNDFLISDITEKISKAESEKLSQETKLKDRIRNLEVSIREKKHHLEMLKIKLKEKDQESKLCLMRISESRKLAKHNRLKPIQRSGHTSPDANLAQLNELKVEEPIRQNMRRRSSTNQKQFHLETMNIIKKIQSGINLQSN